MVQQYSFASKHFQAGAKQICANWKPIVLLQIAALVFVILLYRVPSFAGIPTNVKSLSQKYGLLFSLGSIYFASLFLPEIAKALTKQPLFKWTVPDTLFLLVYYAMIAIILTQYYNFVNEWLGNGTSAGTVALKIVADLLFFSVFVTMPFATAMFLYRDANFSLAKFKQDCKSGEFFKRYCTTLATCWLYFGPFTLALYNAPLTMQYPISMAAQAGWSILLIATAAK